MFEENKFVIFDGAMGTMLQKEELKAGELPEMLNITAPDKILKIHNEYVKSGSEFVTANTFGANRIKIKDKNILNDVITKGVKIAKKSGAKVALDIGPLGVLLKPIGTMDFEEAYDIFKEQIIIGKDADAVIIETMSNLLEAKAAVLAAKENCNLPILATMTFGEDGRTFLGTTPKIATITLCSLGVCAVGINCSLGPKELLPIVKEVMEFATVPVIVQANAGLPQIIDGNTSYNISPKEYAMYIEKMADMGVKIFGGCCGTTPEHINEVKNILLNRQPAQVSKKNFTAITSWQNCIILDKTTAIIGERINPTGKKKLKEALKEKNYDYIVGEAISQEECGADILDVNCGLPEINECETLKEVVLELQSVTALPLQIDSSDINAIEKAIRIYNGKPIINSVNGKKESMELLFPIVKKYGACVVALTLDESGIPHTAEGRYKIAEKILNTALEYGIPKENIIIDCLVLTASTNQNMVMETLKAITLVKSNLGLKTVLGVSNVSFGLPNRPIINSTFLAAAFGVGLDMPILNPLLKEYMQVVNSFKVLNNEDKDAVNFINNFSKTDIEISNENSVFDIKEIIIKGYKSKSSETTIKMLETFSPLEIINDYFIPALDIVGDKFEKGEMFLPQLMASAQTVKNGFDVLKTASEKNLSKEKGTILLATVKGDIHDIGKNIVKMLLENYGYNIIDLGKDVDPQLIVDTVLQNDIKLVGLSALMTTTVKNMQITIELLKEKKANCKVMVGGAVLTPQYAKMVGADYYSKDAMQSAKIASTINFIANNN